MANTDNWTHQRQARVNKGRRQPCWPVTPVVKLYLDEVNEVNPQLKSGCKDGMKHFISDGRF